MADSLRLSQQEIKIIDYLKSHTGSTVYWENLSSFAKDPQTVKMKTLQKVVSDIKRKYKLSGQDVPFDVQFASNKPKTTAQVLVQVKKAPTIPAHNDFVLDPLQKRVKTRYGYHQLNDNEWEMMKYFHSNVGKLITISDLRDKVMFPQYGSKLPARWFDAIMRVINNLRRQVVGLDARLLTVKSVETSYLFQ